MSAEIKIFNADSCRCCRNPAAHFVQLNSISNFAEGKSYFDLLQTITSGLVVSPHEELRMPQLICRKCVKQLKSAYSFILQIRNAYEYYRDITLPIDEVKEFEQQLHETLIEYPGTNNSSNTEEDFQLETKEECRKTYNTDINNDDDVKDVIKLEIKNERIEDFIVYEGLEDDVPPTTDSDDDYDIEAIENDAINEQYDTAIACRCDVCQKVYKDERSLAIHKRFSHMPEENKIPCPLCAHKTSRPSALKVHMSLVHGPKAVEDHYRQGSGKNFPCNMCERGYGRRDDLRRHIRKKHKTLQVDKSFKRKKAQKPREEQRFLCASCGQSFTSKKALDGHQFTHTGERPHECDICNKTFKRIKDMKAHRVIHSEEKPFKCSQCSKSFKRLDKLKMHMRVHSELRPYKCSECEKTFKYPCVLRTHMYTHTGETPFTCKTCGEAFSLRTSLNNHCIKNVHEK